MVTASGTVEVFGDGLLSGASISTGGYVKVDSGAANFTTVSAGGALNVDSVGSASATVVLGGGTENVFNGGTVSGTLVSSGGTLALLGSAALASGTTLLSGANLDLGGFVFSSGGSASIDGNDLLTVTEGGNTFTAQLLGNYAGLALQLSSAGAGTMLYVGAACYCRGTLITTTRGPVAVEALAAGDELVTVSGVARPIIWIGTRSYGGRFLASNDAMLPVLIRAGALGEMLPQRDLFVSPDHAMFLGGVLVPAKSLVNGASIVKVQAADQVDYFHLELPSHDVILAEGAASESFVDDDSRALFQNAAECAHAGQPAGPALYCAPRVEAGHALEAIRNQIAARAGLAAALPQAA